MRLAHSKDRAEGALYELVRWIRPGISNLPREAPIELAVEANVLHTLGELRERCRGLRERE